MIKLEKLRIKQFKSCLNTSFDVNNRLTALIGVNGVGKSNILTAVRLLSKLRANRFFGNARLHIDALSVCQIEMRLNVDNVVYDLKVKISYETDQNNHDEVLDAKFQTKLLGTKKWFEFDTEFVQFMYRYNGNIPSHLNNFIYEHKGSVKFADIKLTRDIIQFLNNINYYGATHFANPSRTPTHLELDGARPVRTEKPHTKFIFDLYSVWRKKDKDTRFNRYLNLVGKEGVGLIDSIKFELTSIPSSSHEIRTGGKLITRQNNKDIIIPIITLDGLNLSPNQLSEGTFKTLALLFYIVSDNNNLLIIEEPEVCVHHGLLSSIIELIKNESRRKQIIISTHSDYILDKLKPDNILLVKKTKEKGTEVKSLSKTLTKNDYNALKYYLNKTGNLGEFWKEGGLDL